VDVRVAFDDFELCKAGFVRNITHLVGRFLQIIYMRYLILVVD
jgi:hypothetical protein